uniref:Uncharacterized protein n=1 Tax=Globodera rostochiensis TaxID=31243 RepID=A0A914I176_GLORO
MLLPPPFSQFCVKLLLIVVAIDVIFLCQTYNAEEWEETKLAKQLDDGILDPSLFFDVNDPYWLSWIGQFSKGIDRCSSLNTDEFNSVRVCTRAQFYGPAGVEAMKRSKQLYAEHRNDMVLVLVSGCVVCPVGFGDSEMTMKLMQFHPEGSMFTSCEQAWENVRSIKIRPKVGTTKPISFIMGAVFAKRRCKGLFSTDKIQLQYNSHFISVENVRCGANHKHMREIPLQNIHTEDYENRALEFVFSAPLDLSRTDRNLRQTQIWGVPSEQAHSKRIKFSDIDCGRVLLANDTAYVEQRAKFPLSFSDPGDTLPLNCASIRGRYFHFSQQTKDRGTDYPLAFIRLVYTDYLFIEMEFASSYAPQNWYCYAIDKKASQTFHMQIYALASCFPNVLITPIEKQYDMDSKGHNYNHDVQMKTNEELVQIFKWMNGTNDIQYTKIGSHHVDFAKHSWTLSHLKLFRNGESPSKNSDNLKLKKSKGTSEMSLSRKFVDWLLNDLDTSVMLDQLNSYNYANDEFFMQTLASNEFLNAPGGFTQKCFDEQLGPGFTRMTIWTGMVAKELCHSGIKRHGICIFGLKDLVPNLNGSHPFLFANKMQLHQDAEAVQCWHEAMFNRTYLFPTLKRLNKKFYTELPQVRYNVAKRQSNGTFNADKFACRYAFIERVKMYQELRGDYKKTASRFKSSDDIVECVIVDEQYQHWLQQQLNTTTGVSTSTQQQQLNNTKDTKCELWAYPSSGPPCGSAPTESAMVEPRHRSPASVIAGTPQPGKFMKGRKPTDKQSGRQMSDGV